MKQVLSLFGNTTGLLGVLICLVSAIARIGGARNLFGHDSLTFFVVGIGLVVVGCFAKIHVLGMPDLRFRPDRDRSGGHG